MTVRVLVTSGTKKDARRYEDALRLVGAEPVVATSGGGAVELDDFEGLLLTGGGDVNPARYGEAAHAKTEAPDDALDEFEIGLARVAVERDLPVFAICRGMQLLNVAMGGTLVQHLDAAERHSVRGDRKSEPAHEARVEAGTKLRAIAGAGALQVNSRHHQAVKELGGGLIVSARDPEDGTIEAAEMPGKRFVVAVQWHPEDQAAGDAAERRIFEAFAEAMAETQPPARLGGSSG